MKSQEGELVVSYLTLRQMIGWIGLLMPIAVRLGAYLFRPHIHTTDSISAYYYTGMRDVFVSTLVLVGVLLTCYRTPSRRDNVVASSQGSRPLELDCFPWGVCPSMVSQGSNVLEGPGTGAGVSSRSA